MTIENKLNQLIQAKQDIKNSIEAKGVTVGGAALAEYPNKIGEITTETTPSRGVVIKEDGEKMEMYVDNGSMLGLLGDSTGLAKVKTLEVINTTGIPITNIPGQTFHYHSNIVIETLPETISSMGYNSFGECKKLGLTKIPDSLKALTGTNFISSGDLKFNTLNNIIWLGTNVFQHASFLVEELSCPKLKTTGNFSFGNISGLKKIILGSPGNPMTSIAVNTFNPSPSINIINIYVNNPANPGLVGAPWGATNATITYLQA